MYSAEWLVCGEVIAWGPNNDFDGMAYLKCLECVEVDRGQRKRSGSEKLRCTIQKGGK